MKKDLSNQQNLKEELLNDLNKINNAPEMDEKPPELVPQKALDDTMRVKVLSPGLLVAKRFFRNKLAIVGMAILLFMFLFSFIGVYLVPYGETEVFFRTETMIYDYGEATYRTDFSSYDRGESVNTFVKTRLQSFIADMVREGIEDVYEIKDPKIPDNEKYRIVNNGDNELYILEKAETIEICQVVGGNLVFKDSAYDTQDFRDKVFENLTIGSLDFEGKSFVIKPGAKLSKIVYQIIDYQDVMVATNYILDPLNEGVTADRDLVYRFGIAFGKTDEFTYADKTYRIKDIDGVYTIALKEGDTETELFRVGSFVVRSSGGFDIFNLSFKNKVKQVVDQMYADGELEKTFNYTTTVLVPVYVYDEDGNIIEDETTYEEEVVEDAEFVLVRYNDRFTIRNNQERLLLDLYSPPSAKHILGTDGNGMDVLIRMMYGGRISLMIGFIVIFIEVIIGVIMGGIAGYFGKWVDNLIMRLVDIFNCIPYLPILIIIGAVFDKLQTDSYERIIWLMIILGVLGWPGIARIVRGQILSLREQEFMIAAEATGISAKRRIFRHLVPNVMPQLIVNATMGLGSIIITESTLSFLGLGAKYPMSTWGAMINNVSSAFALQNYTFIWIPIGMFICLTVIAFNFVGDGLRDAFDPKMKR